MITLKVEESIASYMYYFNQNTVEVSDLYKWTKFIEKQIKQTYPEQELKFDNVLHKKDFTLVDKTIFLNDGITNQDLSSDYLSNMNVDVIMIMSDIYHKYNDILKAQQNKLFKNIEEVYVKQK